ncbi:phenyllactyl-CoA dehydratase activase FldI [Desulfothermus naphthae]
MKLYAGVDAGSTFTKVVVIDNNGIVIGHKIQPTGIDCSNTARELFDNLCRELGISQSNIFVTSTGYGRRMIDFADHNVTEIKAHAVGGSRKLLEGKKIRTLIDIGGQDSKVILIDQEGEVINFSMNDKCAAGTGRFLEVIARVLQVEVKDLGELSSQAKNPCQINSQCAVFAESEVISLLARKKKPSDIIAGIHRSLARRISSMARKTGVEPEVLLTGGGALNPALVAAIEEELMMDVHVEGNPQLNGAIGAALIGKSLNSDDSK